MWSVSLLLGRITQMLSREETHVDASSWHCRQGCCHLIEEHKHLFGFLSSQELQDYNQSQFKWMFVIKILKTNVSKHFPLNIEWYQGSCGLLGLGYKHRKNCESYPSKLPGKSSLNVRSVCPLWLVCHVCPVCPVILVVLSVPCVLVVLSALIYILLWWSVCLSVCHEKWSLSPSELSAKRDAR